MLFESSHTHKNVTAVFFFQLLTTGTSTSTRIERKAYVRGIIYICICYMYENDRKYPTDKNRNKSVVVVIFVSDGYRYSMESMSYRYSSSLPYPVLSTVLRTKMTCDQTPNNNANSNSFGVGARENVLFGECCVVSRIDHKQQCRHYLSLYIYTTLQLP